MHFSITFNNIINVNKSLIKSLVINSFLIQNENFHKIQNLLFDFIVGIIGALFSILDHINILYMRKGTGTVNQFKYRSKEDKHQYTIDKNLLVTNKLQMGHLRNLTYKNFGYELDDAKLGKFKDFIENHELMHSFNSTLQKTLIHPVIITAYESDIFYIEIIGTNLTTKDKPVLLNHLNETLLVNVKNLTKEAELKYLKYQGVLEYVFTIRLKTNNIKHFFRSLEELNNPKSANFVADLGGIEKVNEIKYIISKLLQDNSIPQFSFSNQYSYTVNSILDDLLKTGKIRQDELLKIGFIKPDE